MYMAKESGAVYQDKGVAEPGSMRKPGLLFYARSVLQKYYVIFLLAAIVVASTIASPNFLNLENISIILRYSSVLIVTSMGMLMVILVRGFDLSIEGVIAFASVLIGLFILRGTNLFLGVLLTLIICSVVGILNGVLVSVAGIAPLIVTIGTGSAVAGIAYQINNIILGGSVMIKDEYFIKIFGGRFGFIHSPFLIMVGVAIILWFVLGHTIAGRKIRIIGGNPVASRLSGIRNNLYTIICYVACSLAAALAGIMVTAQIKASTPRLGTGYAIDSLAVVFLGGASFNGGIGSIINTVLAGLTFGVISNLLNLVNLPVYPQMIIKGAILVGIVAFRRVRVAR